MSILNRFKNILDRVTSDSVSCGSLAVFACALPLLLLIMWTFSHS